MTTTLSVKLDGPHRAAALDPLSSDGEAAWLPVLGPSAYCIARVLLRTGDTVWDVEALASRCGIGATILDRAIMRLVHSGLARLPLSEQVLYLRPLWPPAPPLRRPITTGAGR